MTELGIVVDLTAPPSGDELSELARAAERAGLDVVVLGGAPDGAGEHEAVDELAGADQTAKGGYVLAEASNAQPQVILIGTGSEVQLCLVARERLEAEGTPTRVVSMPCQEWFREQDMAYQDSVLPRDVKARVSVEAGIAMSWRDLIGDHGEAVSLEHYGASAPHTVLFEQFGFTPDRIMAAAHASLTRLGDITGTTTGN